MTYELIPIPTAPPPPVAKVSLTAEEIGKIKALLGHCVGGRCGTTEMYHKFSELASAVQAPMFSVPNADAIRDLKPL